MLVACSPEHAVEKPPTHASTVAHRVMPAKHRVLLSCSDACAEDQQDDAWPQLHQVAAAVDSLANGKATGPDGIPAELLIAGGSPLVRRLHQVIRCAVRNISIPHAWKGGRLATAWKMKGLPDICDNHRGLLLGDHSGKVMTSLLKDQLDEPYLKALPNAQSGCVRNRSTPFVCHTVRLFLDNCRTTHRSVFVLFLDLTKAFDFIVREFVMGRKKCDCRDVLTALADLGLSAEDVILLAKEIEEHGSFLEICGTSALVANIVAELQSGSWFSIGELTEILLTDKGGRQGCFLGAIIFNFVYARDLSRLEHQLLHEGIFIRIPIDRDAAPWESRPQKSSPLQTHAIFDATFVDDEAIMLAADTPQKLDTAITTLLKCLETVFAAFKLTINWSRGKTEALCTYRGKQAGDHWKARFI